MIIKNTFKIMFSNTSTVVKSCLYKLFVICCILLLGYGVLSPIFQEFKKAGVLQDVVSFFADGIFKFNSEVIVSTFGEISNSFLQIMDNNISFTWNFVALFVLLAVLLPLLLGLSKVAECDVLFGRLSSNSEFGFLTSYFENFKKGFIFRLVRLLFSIPTLIIALALCYFYARVFAGKVDFVIAIVLMILSIIAICSLFMTLFLIYEPNLVIKGGNPFKAIKDSVEDVAKFGFFKVFLTLFAVSTIVVLINAFLAVFTYGITLLITIPLSIQFFNVLRMVICYDCLGMDYYLNDKNVWVTKKKYEKNSIQEMQDIL